jgi:predicted short-subunit dehydrogenase-like oxidoreductase (DUF2520 family)
MNIIGAGKVGRVLGRLLGDADQFRIQQVLNRSMASARSAAEFMGQGEATDSWSELRAADAWMIGSNDRSIKTLAEQLAQAKLVAGGQLVFHLSGALCADELAALGRQGAVLASLHPLKSFPDPLIDYQSFAGTYCALEGDERVCQRLERALQGIAARPFKLDAQQKLAYHAANTILSNYLLALLDVGLGCYREAGIEHEQAMEMVAPLMQQTLANGMALGPERALTGPLARGDKEIVRQHLSQLPDFAQEIYRSLGLHALQMAHQSGRLGIAQFRDFRKIFDPDGQSVE